MLYFFPAAYPNIYYRTIKTEVEDKEDVAEEEDAA